MFSQKEILQLPTFTHKKQIDETCSALFKATGLSFFEYIKLDGASQCGSFITNCYEGLETSLNHSMYQTSCFTFHPDQYPRGSFLWSEFPNNQADIELRSIHGFKDGISLIYKTHDTCHMFGFAGREQDLNITALLHNNHDLLTTFSGYFLTQNSQLVHDAWEKKITLLQPTNTEFQQPHNTEIEKLTQQYLNQYQNNDAANIRCDNHLLTKLNCELNSLRHSHEETLHHINHITEREKQCLKLTAQGYPTKEIAKTMGLSSRTIDNYIEKLKKLLNCTRRSELITQYACLAG